MGLLENRKTVEVVQDGAVQGYAFTDALSGNDLDQLQRWFLYATYQPVAKDVKASFRQATASPWSEIVTAEAFIEEVQRQFREGDRYIKVNCSLPKTPDTPGWERIPDEMPYPPFPALGKVKTPRPRPAGVLEALVGAIAGGRSSGVRVELGQARWQSAAGELEIERAVFRPMQADPGTGKIWQGGAGKGFTFTTLQSGSPTQPLTTYERFLFDGGYEAVPGSRSYESTMDGIESFGNGSLAAWVSEMNGSYWGTGSSVVLCSCSWGYTAGDIGILERSRARPARKAAAVANRRPPVSPRSSSAPRRR